ncbi:hypothetical protein [uncultured Thiodictyon sp.]|uniref:hypothetical protein n=1 Tax=uncultured Thiodictyon sp. TaxID=1846217 RepID=UPI0025E7C562|nr:hypothetical protein [uncultured Thiodictyon sp.]
MKNTLFAFLLVLPVHAYAFDYLKFAVEDTLKCAHPTVKEGKAEIAVSPSKQGDKETARVKIFYKGMLKANSMLVEYAIMTTSSGNLIQAKVLEDTSSIPAKKCNYFSGWQELKE